MIPAPDAGFFVMAADDDIAAAVARWLRNQHPAAVVCHRGELDSDPEGWMTQHGTDLVVCPGWENAPDGGIRYRFALTHRWPIWLAQVADGSFRLDGLRPPRGRPGE